MNTKQEGLLVRIPENLLPQGFDPDSESFSLSFSGSNLLILKRKRRGATAGERQVVRLWGNLGNFSVPDVLLLLFNNHQTGMLSFDLPGAHKTVYVQNGELVFAQSSLKDDRLGECLVRMGKITQGELDSASTSITAERKLGKILVDMRALSAKELFDGVRRQSEEIIYSLFHYREGNFNFFESRVDDEDVVVLNLDTRDVILRGMKRELGIDGLPFENVYPIMTGRAVNLELNIEERELQSLVSEGVSVSDVIRQMRLGDIDVLRLLYRFERNGLIAFAAREFQAAEPETGAGKLERTITDFNSIFMDVYSILRVKVTGIDVLGRLNSFFDDMPAEIAEVFDQTRFLDDGSLPTDRILGNVRQIERDDKIALTIKAFNELLYFALFEMRNYLSREDAERLMEIVQNMELF